MLWNVHAGRGLGAGLGLGPQQLWMLVSMRQSCMAPWTTHVCFPTHLRHPCLPAHRPCSMWTGAPRRRRAPAPGRPTRLATPPASR